MGRKAQASAKAATFWLPGFEPEGYESAQLDIQNALGKTAAATPPSAPRLIAVASASVVHEAWSAPANQALTHSTRDALRVVGEIDSESDLNADADAVLKTLLQAMPEPEPKRQWPQFDSKQFAPATGTHERIEANINAIKLAKEISAAGRDATDSERHQLLKYVGWGGLARVFENIERNTLGEYQTQLKGILSDAEFASARASTTSAFYTEPTIVSAMWNLVERLGFKGGRVIEPAAGTGRFLAGMPAALARESEITAVEMDKVTGEILKTAFSGLGIQTLNAPIEKANVPHGFYDLAISNVPFGDHKTLETRKVGYSNWLIHNYFFGKAVDMVRPGGLIVFVTSTGTMDSKTQSHREWLNAHAEMLGAIRLPANAFKELAGTGVVTDIIVMKKRKTPMFKDAGQWIARGNAPESMLVPGQSLMFSTRSGYQPYERPINEWFVGRPAMVIGQIVVKTGQYGQVELVPTFSGDQPAFEQALQNCVLGMPQGVYEEAQVQPQDSASTSMALQRVQATAVCKPGSYVLHGGRIHISEGETWIDVDEAYKGLTRERLLGLMKVRDAARSLIAQQAASSDEAQFKSLQHTLNVLYDSFVSKYGNIGESKNTRVFKTDPECPLVLSLESYNEDEEKFEKADIFTRRTAGRREPPKHADSVKDAMLISLALHGRIVLADMVQRFGKPRADIEAELRDEALAFIDPQDGYWKPRDEYLSGHIRNKTGVAKAAGVRFQRNVAALESVLPKDLGPGEVEVRLGAPWVPTAYLEEFAANLIKAKAGDLTVVYDANSATWSVKTGGHKPEWAGDRLLNTSQWGTRERCAVVLMEAALNQVPPKITRTTSDGKTYVDKTATMAAREKYEAIKAEFKKWAYADAARRDALLRIYNDQFNQIVDRRYDGSHLTLYGMSDVITPYSHQLDAIWRIVSGGNTLLAHVVGAGKTFTMVAAAMELRRIGKANKPCVAVPNHLLYQFAGDCVRFYPNAKVLIASKEDFVGDKRREFTARICNGDWDLVLITHSTFEKLSMRPETTNRFVEGLLGQARLALSNAQDAGAKRTVKQLETRLKALEAKVEQGLNARAKDDFIYFDDLGIDFLMFDEAHSVKNLMRVSKMPNIAGLSNAASNRAFDFWVKSSIIMEMRGDVEQGVVLSTATPISNSVAEAHTMMKYLQPYTLKEMGLYEFDAWASTFGEAVTGMEISPDGGGYRLATRFAKFVNVADLMSIFRLSADIKTRSMLKLPTPAIKGLKPLAVVAPGSQELKAFTDTLVKRAEAIRSGSVRPEEDNMLAVTNSGRKAALDMRLINPTLPFDPNGKVALACRNILRVWKETMAERGTQLVFCDLSTPNSKGFSVYHDLRDRLIDEGIPAEEIAFIHDHDTDAAKDKLFRQVRAGRVRVLIGSTQKMGMGTNVQKRLKAVLQLDSPWRPADVEQRDGRGLRAGNMWEEIELLRFVTEGSFDAYIWNLLSVKANFIEQIMSSATGLRTVEDLSMGALTFAEIKAIASGNPLVLEKAGVDAEALKLTILKDQWLQEQWRLSSDAKHNAKEIEAIQRSLPGVKKDAAALSEAAKVGWVFKPNGPVGSAVLDEPDVATQIGLHAIQIRSGLDKGWCGEVVVGSVCGAKIILSCYVGIDLKIEGTSRTYSIDRHKVHFSNAQGTGNRVLEALVYMIEVEKRLMKEASDMERENRDIAQRLAMPFEYEDRLAAVIARQREIEAALDLDKDEEGTTGADATAETPA